MQLYKNGMKLMKDTGSLTNALCENTTSAPKVGDTFCELGWTDRRLFVITQVISPKKFIAQRCITEMKDGWEDGTEYPVMDENGKIKTYGEDEGFNFSYRNWRQGLKKGRKVHLQFGAKTGYRDPSF